MNSVTNKYLIVNRLILFIVTEIRRLKFLLINEHRKTEYN
jgi:hypothetical protein